MLISLEKEKKAPVIFLTLTGQTREAILELDLDTFRQSIFKRQRSLGL